MDKIPCGIVGINECWLDIDFFQYPLNWSFENLKFSFTHRVSNIEIFKDF
jgi:hypothetical protein